MLLRADINTPGPRHIERRSPSRELLLTVLKRGNVPNGGSQIAAESVSQLACLDVK